MTHFSRPHHEEGDLRSDPPVPAQPVQQERGVRRAQAQVSPRRRGELQATCMQTRSVYAIISVKMRIIDFST